MRAPTIAAAVLLALAACQSVPYTHRSHLVLIPSGEETQLGLTQYQQTLQTAKLSHDPAQVDLVRRVGQRIAAAADRPDYKWEFNVIDDPKTVNAWCLPGGKVAVYTGILPVTKDENGLAVVLGHEVSHALARHGAERMSQGLLAQFGGVALGAALSSKPAETQQLYSAAYGAGTTVGVLLPFSREQESEADHIGLILMAKAGYDPRGAVAFWQRMLDISKSSSRPPALLSDHPADEKRIAQIEKWLPEALTYYKPR
jgi:predicted Zn-dependent protease